MSDAPCMRLLAERAVHFDTRLCIGLDPVRERIPPLLGNDPDPMLTFCRGIVDATAEHALAYKPNVAFFESDGAAGWERLEALLAYIPDQVPIILDAKRGDIGSSSQRYAHMAFDQLGADAITVSPYMGRDSIDPFLAYTERGIFVLAATSNPGADDFQSLRLHGGESLAGHIARTVVSWNEHGNLGLVVGATRPERIQQIRAVAPDLPFLIPGVGTQGGDPQAFMAAALDRAGDGVIVVAGRSILYTDDPDFQKGASNAAGRLRQQLNRARQEALDAR